MIKGDFVPKNPYKELTSEIIGMAIEVHRILGPGMLESVYETCLVYELRRKGLHVEQQKVIAVQYKDITLEKGYVIDILVEQKIVVELKTVTDFLPVHTAQVLSYLRLSGCKVGLLINFNVRLLKNGIKRLVI